MFDETSEVITRRTHVQSVWQFLKKRQEEYVKEFLDMCMFSMFLRNYWRYFWKNVS